MSIHIDEENGSVLISDLEIEELRQEIIRVVKEIIHGDFLTMPCDPERSDYCSLVDSLRLRK